MTPLRPTSDLGRFESLGESDLRLIMLEPLEVQASTIDARVRRIEKLNRSIYIELGALVLYFDEKKLWHYCFDEKGDRFNSLEGWIVNACPYSRSYALEAKAKVKVLRESGTPMDELLNVPRCNVLLLAQLSSDIQRDPEVLKDAQTLSEDAFREKIIREFPSQCIEPKKKMIFDFEQTAREVVDEAIKLAMEKWECSRQAAVEGIFAEWLVAQKQEEAKVVAANA
jgi:hypothetical protein